MKTMAGAIAAPLLTCSLSHVLVLVNPALLDYFVSLVSGFCLVEENRETCLTENIQQKRGKLLHSNGRKSTVGLISISARMNF